MHQPMKAVCNIDVLEHSFEEEVFQIRLFQVFVSERLDQLQHYWFNCISRLFLKTHDRFLSNFIIDVCKVFVVLDLVVVDRVRREFERQQGQGIFKFDGSPLFEQPHSFLLLRIQRQSSTRQEFHQGFSIVFQWIPESPDDGLVLVAHRQKVWQVYDLVNSVLLVRFRTQVSSLTLVCHSCQVEVLYLEWVGSLKHHF